MTPPAVGLSRLERVLDGLGRVVVAFSGGADSALLGYVANRTLGTEKVLCVTSSSASLAADELADCRALAAEWGLRHLVVETNELADAAYVRNDLDRCYHCKRELMDVLAGPARTEGATIALGVNVDDLSDYRPGQRAATERGAVFPLVEAELTKHDVRELSRHLGLRTWDKPAAACLASRVPHGTPVTLGVLSRVEAAESALRALGFRVLRVRHYGETARIELGLDELARALEARDAVVAAVQSAGYRHVTLDLEGFRSGNLSRTASKATRCRAPRRTGSRRDRRLRARRGLATLSRDAPAGRRRAPLLKKDAPLGTGERDEVAHPELAVLEPFPPAHGLHDVVAAVLAHGHEPSSHVGGPGRAQALARLVAQVALDLLGQPLDGRSRCGEVLVRGDSRDVGGHRLVLDDELVHPALVLVRLVGEVGKVRRTPDHAGRRLGERERGLRRDRERVAGHARPDRDRRDAGLGERGAEHADDAGRPLVTRQGEAGVPAVAAASQPVAASGTGRECVTSAR